jgi:predicted nuclease with TOPRIM domain
MKKFQFTLARVREYRRLQADLEQAKLRALEHKLRELTAELHQIDTRFQMEVDTVGDSPSERGALGHFRVHYRDQRMRLAYRIGEATKDVETQRGIYVAATQRAEVLSRIEQKQRKIWEADFQKELDSLAMDSFLAQWNPEKPDSPPN